MLKSTKKLIIFVVKEIFNITLKLIEDYLSHEIDVRPPHYDLKQEVDNSNFDLDNDELVVDYLPDLTNHY